MAIHEEVKEAVGNGNYKVVAEQPSIHLSEMMADHRIISKQMSTAFVRSSERLQGGLDSAVIRAVRDFAEPNIEEGKAVVKMDSGVDPMSQGHILANTTAQLNTLAPNLAQILNGVLASNEQLNKLITALAAKG